MPEDVSKPPPDPHLKRGAPVLYPNNASCTFPGNRIEWNREGILIVAGDGYNSTGNFFDRAGTCGLAVLGGEQMSITGNFIKRSGKDAKPGTTIPPRSGWSERAGLRVP
jgi:hypothetical protein